MPDHKLPVMLWLLIKSFSVIVFNIAIILCWITKVIKNNVLPSLWNQILCRIMEYRERILDYVGIGLEKFD